MLRIASALGALAVALPLLGVISSIPAGADGYFPEGYRGQMPARTGYDSSRRSFSGSAMYPQRLPGRGYTMGFRSGPHGRPGYRSDYPSSYRVGHMGYRFGYSGARNYHVERQSAFYGDRRYGVRYQSTIYAPDYEVDDRPLYDVGADYYDRPDYWGGANSGYGVAYYSGAGYYRGPGYYPTYVNCGCHSGWSMFR
jgi:hypothetical protein